MRLASLLTVGHTYTRAAISELFGDQSDLGVTLAWPSGLPW